METATIGPRPFLTHRRYDEGFYEDQFAGALQSARKLFGVLAPYHRPQSVADFGCGRGAWLVAAAELWGAEMTGFDGAWVNPADLASALIRFTATDLEAPIACARRFDLAVSVEVAEHLSPARGPGFVADLCAASDVVLFGAATPRQGGTRHINERPQSYWGRLFAERGYERYDIFRPALWDDPAVEYWYRQNAFLYVNRDAAARGPDRDALRAGERLLVDVVHPEHLERLHLSSENPRLRTVLGLARRYLASRLR